MLENKLCYNDEYVYFYFDGIYSKNKKVFIRNNEDELKMIFSSNGSVEFSTPKYQNKTYALGISNPRRSIPLSLIAYNISRRELRDICKWLKVGTNGALVFDYATDWCYNTIIENVSDPILTSCGGDEFFAEFEVTFSTVGAPQARTLTEGVYSSMDDTLSSNNLMSLPPIIKISDNEYRLLFLGNDKLTLDIDLETDIGNDFDIEITNELSDAKLVIERTIAQNATVMQNGIMTFQYRSGSHLLFVNNFLSGHAEQQDKRLQCKLNTEPFVFASISEPIQIKSPEHFEELKSNNISSYRMVCSYHKAVENSDVEYALSDTGFYPFEVSGNFVEEKDWSGDYTNWYFVHYVPIKIVSTNISKITLITQNYTEVL